MATFTLAIDNSRGRLLGRAAGETGTPVESRPAVMTIGGMVDTPTMTEHSGEPPRGAAGCPALYSPVAPISAEQGPRSWACRVGVSSRRLGDTVGGPT